MLLLYTLICLFKCITIGMLYSVNQKLIAMIMLAIGEFCLIMPVLAGVIRVLYRRIRNIATNTFDMFYYFEHLKRYFNVLYLFLAILVRLILIFIIPFSFIACGVSVLLYFSSFDIYTLLLLFLILIVFIITFHVCFFFSLRYFMAVFIFINDDNIKISTAIKLSVEKMKFRKNEILIVIYTLLPLLFLCLFIIPAFFILPYMVAVFTVYGTMYLKQFYIQQDVTKTLLFGMGD